MEEDNFQSLSKGVFVIPFQNDTQNEAGPSKPCRRPLEKFYDTAYEHYENAYIKYNNDKISEQLDDIQDWLDRCSNSSSNSLLKLKNPIYRLEIGLLQNTSFSSFINSEIHTIGKTCILQGKDINDINQAMKLISLGFMEGDLSNDKNNNNRKNGKSGLDEIKLWYTSQKIKSSLLLYIQDAQMIPSSVLGELMYILSLHPSIPIRLLISVPSISHFLSSWTPIELSSIAPSILSSTTSKKNTGVEAILRASGSAPLQLSDELIDELRSEEAKFGGGPISTLKAIKWLLLHHSINSPLSRLATSSDLIDQKKVQALLNTRLHRPPISNVPGEGLFRIKYNKDLSSVMNPAPRTSILHALSNSEDYIRTNTDLPLRNGEEQHPSSYVETSSQLTNKRQALEPLRSSKRKRIEDEEGVGIGHRDGDDGDIYKGKGEEMKELKMLFELWKNAGKSVNLWDWLEGFHTIMTDCHNNDGDQNKSNEEDDQINEEVIDQNEPIRISEERKQNTTNDDDENESRLHAIFIRFVEEARMIGLIRARGKGKKADEVVKGVGLV
ncbi:uncharacterized protein I206_104032 [Kwoniella pini CBS 10737]|uniref:Origin recognition complex subunit 3 winged helix C-terminal domain-containing protein n=1 Tax=Kwoniella pini CBS 10737 TaxID=1296096 RepID=A0A1B9I2U8_9TREE|nr:uncharacterized protein I206_04393 [Kwoniella pini CBS 10737]OCF49866.1 hypothetical protein I206_04393 [Kwoniella pini CBS 10737]